MPAVVTFSRPITSEGYGMLVEMLEIQKRGFLTEAELTERETGAKKKRERVWRFAKMMKEAEPPNTSQVPSANIASA